MPEKLGHQRVSGVRATGFLIVAIVVGLLTPVMAIEERSESSGTTVVILGIEPELEAFNESGAPPSWDERHGIRHREWVESGHQIVLVPTAFGKTNAAVSTLHAIREFEPDFVIFSGTTGSLRPDLKTGDLAVCAQVLHHDVGKRKSEKTQGFEPWQTRSFTDFRRNPLMFSADSRLVDLAMNLGNSEVFGNTSSTGVPSVQKVISATGDTFVAHSTFVDALRARTDADIVEMEGAAMAQVCYAYDIPWLMIRGVTDQADSTAEDSYSKNMPRAAGNAAQLTLAVVKNLGSLPEKPARPDLTKPRKWLISYELAFGTGSPYSKEFPDLYGFPYEPNQRISEEVLRPLTSEVLALVGIEDFSLNFTPGAYLDYPVVPSAQLEVVGNEKQVKACAAAIGYLAQQSVVLVSTEATRGRSNALRVIEDGGSSFGNPEASQRIWRALSSKQPSLTPGFAGGHSGNGQGATMYIIDTDGDWLYKEIAKIPTMLDSVAAEVGLALHAEPSRVEFRRVGNNWVSHHQGRDYLRIIRAFSNDSLVEEIQKLDPKVKDSIERAFKAGAPALAAKAEALHRLDDGRAGQRAPRLYEWSLMRER